MVIEERWFGGLEYKHFFRSIYIYLYALFWSQKKKCVQKDLCADDDDNKASYLLGASCWSDTLISPLFVVICSTLNNSLLMSKLLLSPFYKWVNWGPKWFARVTQIISNRAGIWMRAGWFQRLVLEWEGYHGSGWLGVLQSLGRKDPVAGLDSGCNAQSQ